MLVERMAVLADLWDARVEFAGVHYVGRRLSCDKAVAEAALRAAEKILFYLADGQICEASRLLVTDERIWRGVLADTAIWGKGPGDIFPAA